jgi:hypothetical protein
VLICILCGSSVMARLTLKSPRRARKLQRSTWGQAGREQVHKKVFEDIIGRQTDLAGLGNRQQNACGFARRQTTDTKD